MFSDLTSSPNLSASLKSPATVSCPSMYALNALTRSASRSLSRSEVKCRVTSAAPLTGSPVPAWPEPASFKHVSHVLIHSFRKLETGAVIATCTPITSSTSDNHMTLTFWPQSQCMPSNCHADMWTQKHTDTHKVTDATDHSIYAEITVGACIISYQYQ